MGNAHASEKTKDQEQQRNGTEGQTATSQLTAEHDRAQRFVQSGHLDAQSTLALQRTVGNRATATLVHKQQLAVQRQIEDDEEGGTEKTFGALDTVGGHVGQWSGGAQFASVPNSTNTGSVSDYTTGNTTTGGASGGISSAGIGVITGLGGAITGSLGAHKAGKTMDEEEAAGRKDQAKYREAKRTRRGAIVGATTSSVGVVSQGLSGISGISQVMANAGSSTAFAGANNLIGGVGGIIALPVAAFSVSRTANKLRKQGLRFHYLRKSLVDPNTSVKEATKALENHRESIKVAIESRNVVVTDRDAIQTELDRFANAKGFSSQDAERVRALRIEKDQLESAIADFDQKISDLNDQTGALDLAKATAEFKMTEMVDRAKAGQETAEDIRLYATTKNQGGVVKKTISVVGGLLGLGGGIAGTIGTLAFAGVGLAAGVATAATPVGWALAGAAALIGLGLAGYGFFKWYRKRLDRAGKEGLTGFQKFKTALNPFKKIGKSRREHMAERLWELASHAPSPNPQVQQEADKSKKIIKDLGLDFDALHMGDPTQKDSSIKLIHDKMAS